MGPQWVGNLGPKTLGRAWNLGFLPQDAERDAQSAVLYVFVLQASCDPTLLVAGTTIAS